MIHQCSPASGPRSVGDDRGHFQGRSTRERLVGREDLVLAGEGETHGEAETGPQGRDEESSCPWTVRLTVRHTPLHATMRAGAERSPAACSDGRSSPSAPLRTSALAGGGLLQEQP